MPYTHLQILIGIVLPAVLMVAGLAMAPRAGWFARWIPAPLAAIGFLIAYWTFEPRVSWPPTANVIYLLFYYAIPIAVLGVIDSWLKPPTWLRMLVMMLLWWLAIALLLAPLTSELGGSFAAEAWVDAMALIATIWWLTFETLADRWPGVTAPLLLAIFAAAAAVLLVAGWYIQLSAALAAALMAMSLAAMVVAAFGCRISLAHGLIQTCVLLLLLVLVHGYFYTDATLSPLQQTWAALFAVSPLLAFVGDIPLFRRRHAALRLAARIILVLIVLGIVCGATVHDYLHVEQAQSSMSDE